ncbi:MAG: HNH endonuclease [Aeromicrobium sp.]|nr:HNH endonuclease [Aeromicrobium sp.]
MNFEERYGEVGREFIHVHHVESLAAIGGRHKVDPQKDLLPLCPNCHAMIHRLPHPQTVDALVELLRRPRDDASET